MGKRGHIVHSPTPKYEEMVTACYSGMIGTP
eukprot:CAMPEP_0197257728 /NCGR_PEP_ID=MMETSP1429-20130617/79782_1 /TAXON_ID=49237 /ORGANISM="Chaetoceros  sp., Strain UNC1202" /LENGTH=30 /DNA_ID= /DNA_START= /DNA_END= /DNA_ORIENTATION=